MQSIFSKTDLKAKQSWIYPVLFMSVGPVGPGGGIYSSTEDVLCRVNFRKMMWRPNNRGYMQFCFCLWALLGPLVGYSIIDYVVCKVYFLMDQVDHVIC